VCGIPVAERAKEERCSMSNVGAGGCGRPEKRADNLRERMVFGKLVFFGCAGLEDKLGRERSGERVAVGHGKGFEKIFDERLWGDVEFSSKAISGDAHAEEVAELAIVGDTVTSC
jgi:hypothetical protein